MLLVISQEQVVWDYQYTKKIIIIIDTRKWVQRGGIDRYVLL